MSVTASAPLVDSRNGRKRTVTPWNKCAACDNSVDEHLPGRWDFKREDALYCSNACRQRAYRRRKKGAA